MQVSKYESKDEWMFARIGKITGSRLKDIVSKRDKDKKKIGFYELIAERLGVPPDGENPMERGSRLEVEAVQRFYEETGKEVDTGLYLWRRDDNESIAISPDAVVVGEKAAVEAKCLASARHIEAYLTKQIPDEYEYQKIQYFVVNDELETLYFVFYDPRFAMFTPTGLAVGEKASPLDYFVIEVRREDIKTEIAACLEYQRKVLEEVNNIVNSLTF